MRLTLGFIGHLAIWATVLAWVGMQSFAHSYGSAFNCDSGPCTGSLSVADLRERYLAFLVIVAWLWVWYFIGLARKTRSATWLYPATTSLLVSVILVFPEQLRAILGYLELLGLGTFFGVSKLVQAIAALLLPAI